jgi:type IV secretory pathway VirJ component
MNKLITLFFLNVLSYSFSKAQDAKSIQGLPIDVSRGEANEPLVLYLTGDGGNNNFNQTMVAELSKKGYNIIALNTRKYFWGQKSPEKFSQDIQAVLYYYMREWKKTTVVLVGYSFGADVGSFLPRYLPEDLQKKVKSVILMSPSTSTGFEVKLSELLSDTESLDRKYKVQPEIERSQIPVICVFGKEEKLLLKSALKNKDKVVLYEIPGDHQYNQDFNKLMAIIKTHEKY